MVSKKKKIWKVPHYIVFLGIDANALLSFEANSIPKIENIA